jgi:hypothetical protein
MERSIETTFAVSAEELKALKEQAKRADRSSSNLISLFWLQFGQRYQLIHEKG